MMEPHNHLMRGLRQATTSIERKTQVFSHPLRVPGVRVGVTVKIMAPCPLGPLPFVIPLPWGGGGCPFQHSGTSTDTNPSLWLLSAELRATGTFLSFCSLLLREQFREIHSEDTRIIKMVWFMQSRVLIRTCRLCLVSSSF